MFQRHFVLILSTVFLFLATTSALDLQIPLTSQGDPGPGKRVRHKHPERLDKEAYHMLYLPPSWQHGQKYPLVVEYPPNQWEEFTGRPDETKLGYGMTEGQAIWLSLPVISWTGENELWWWGDRDATIQYAKDVVKMVIERYCGGDSNAVVLVGFSRGSIATNFIGLAEDDIAALWNGFVANGYYDGITFTSRGPAVSRLRRLGDRPQFIIDEDPRRLEATKDFLQENAPNGTFTFQQPPTTAHTDRWVLTKNEARDNLRAWYQSVLSLSAPPTATPTFSFLPPTMVPSPSDLPSQAPDVKVASGIPSAEPYLSHLPSLSNLPSQLAASSVPPSSSGPSKDVTSQVPTSASPTTALPSTAAPSTSGPGHKVYFGVGQAVVIILSSVFVAT